MAPRARIWLVRHGRTAWTGVRYCGRADPALSSEGLADARKLAVRLSEHFDEPPRVHTSPARRAISTATEICSVAGGSQPIVDDRLAEMDVGDAEGMTWNQFQAAHPDLATAVLGGRPIDWPGGETEDGLQARATAVWRSIGTAGVGTLVVVSHGLLIRALLEAAGVASSPRDVTGPERLAIPAASAIGLARVAGRWSAVARVAAD